jgi:hypothetical protein
MPRLASVIKIVLFRMFIPFLLWNLSVEFLF